MFSFRNKVQESVDSLREQGATVAHSAGDALSRVVAHIATLAELFAVEVEECADRVVDKARVLFIGLCLFICGYWFLMALVCLLLSEYIGWAASLGSVGGFHLVVGYFVVRNALKRKMGPIAPDTVQEIKNDVQCIRILSKDESAKS